VYKYEYKGRQEKMEKGRDAKGGDRPVKICTRKARHAWPWPLEIEIPVGVSMAEGGAAGVAAGAGGVGVGVGTALGAKASMIR
jgi:hypothetical protein